MPRWFFIGILVIALIVVVPPMLQKQKETAAREERVNDCDRMMAERTEKARQGTDPVELAVLDAAIARCVDRANAAGADYDATAIALEACTSKRQQWQQEISHYRSTNSDALKRNNTFGTIMRLGEDSVTCYRAVLARLTTAAQLDTFLVAARADYAAWDAFMKCFQTDGPGCGQQAGEPERTRRAQDIGLRVMTPLLSVIQTAVRARQRLVTATVVADARARSLSTSVT